METNSLVTGTMTHKILLTRFQGEKTMHTYPGWACIFREATTKATRNANSSSQAFSITTDFDPKLMPKIQN